MWRKIFKTTPLNLGMPVRRDGEFPCVLIALISIGEVSQYIANLPLASNSNAFILYDRSQDLAHIRLVKPYPGLSEAKTLPSLTGFSDPVLAAIRIAEVFAPETAAAKQAGQQPIRRRLGNYSGWVIVGNIGAPGRMNYTIIGDAVNVSQRLKQVGKRVYEVPQAVSVLIGATTASQFGPEFEARTMGAHKVPSRQQEVEVFSLF